MKEKMFYLILFITVLYSCVQPEKPITNSQVDCSDLGYVNVQKWRKEILHIDSLLINNRFKLNDGFNKLDSLLGGYKNFTNVNRDLLSFYSGHEGDKFRYYYESVFIDKWKNKSQLSFVDFEKSGLSIVHPKITLNSETLSEEVCNLYPNSCRLININGNKWSGFIELRITDASLESRRIFLIFKAQKLVKMKIVNLSPL